MAHKIPRCIEWLSSIHTLEPGDLVATGTNHRGLSSFMDGDTVELETEGLGRLRIHIQDQLKRTWARTTRLEHKESKKEGVHTPQLTGKVRAGNALSAATARTTVRTAYRPPDIDRPTGLGRRRDTRYNRECCPWSRVVSLDTAVRG
ncbi:MAG: fumarylacetoacetate hydrolase family protein [Pseudomonadota bacterium]